MTELNIGENNNWDGNGLPHDGAEVEIVWTRDDHPTWYKAKVECIRKSQDGSVCGVVFCEDGYYPFSLSGEPSAKLRPIKTEEQKKEREIDELLELALDHCSMSDSYKTNLRRLLDAGMLIKKPE